MNIQFINCTIKKKDFQLNDISWKIKNSQSWAVLGENGVGKTTLMKALLGRSRVFRGQIKVTEDKTVLKPSNYIKKIGFVSFEQVSTINKNEKWKKEMNYFRGDADSFTSVKDFLRLDKSNSSYLNLLDIKEIIDRDITKISTGQMRKVLIARALLKDPSLLILDEPFDGLDKVSREELEKILSNLVKEINIILITHRVEEISPFISNVLMLKKGQVFAQGSKNENLNKEKICDLYDIDVDLIKEGGRYKLDYLLDNTDFKKHKAEVSKLYENFHEINLDTIIKIRNLDISYRGFTVFEDFNWRMQKGENWIILGLNGSGKTTLINLINADHKQRYANDIEVFGHSTKDNSSIWDIKKYIGIISSEIQVKYDKDMSGKEVIYSGFFDSVGLYKRPNQAQKHKTDIVIDSFDLSNFVDKKFRDLSYGQQRMILIARAMIKPPHLLILDEPTQGLDIKNRKKLLKIVKFIAEDTPTSVILTTHHDDEVIEGFEVLKLNLD
jgi:molybdate transport system ATP-binding protein